MLITLYDYYYTPLFVLNIKITRKIELRYENTNRYGELQIFHLIQHLSLLGRDNGEF